MAGSQSEEAIREAVVAKMREHFPNARIIHEMTLGASTADLAIVDVEHVVFVEIKSERDVLDRLKQQVRTYAACGHAVVVAAHEKWFKRGEFEDGTTWLNFDHATHFPSGVWPDVWAYPEPPEARRHSTYRWRKPRVGIEQPHAKHLLGIMLKDELVAEARRHGVPFTRKSTAADLYDLMAYHMTGREIAQAACRQIRARRFARADAPILVPSEPVPAAQSQPNGLLL